MTHEMKLKQEPFDYIVNGIKSVELRLYDEKRQQISVGDKIRFSLIDRLDQSIESVVVNLHRFNSFMELLSTRLFDKCGWKELTSEEAVENMRQYYTETEEKDYGVIGIEICITKNGKQIEVWKLGTNKTESDYLFNLVKQGIKAATSYLHDENFDKPYKYSILTNWDATEEIRLETISFCTVPFNEVTKEHAWKEGEGSRRLEEWRIIHKEFFSKRLALQGKKFDGNIKIVCEEFKIIR